MYSIKQHVYINERVYILVYLKEYIHLLIAFMYACAAVQHCTYMYGRP
jgi:hypothetical protein